MSEDSKTVIFDVEHLQQMSYERSTKWANFFDSISVSEDQVSIDIVDFEELYDDGPEDQDELFSMEDESCDDKSLDSEVLRDITNTTRLAFMLSGHNKTAKLSETTVNNVENQELVDLFNQTMPVINEHNRKLKESGLDRVLDTFDANKIEEKVGGWLRRHNSLCNPVIRKANPCLVQKQTSECRSAVAVPYRNYRDDDTDTDDSFHSGETARYIRSSRAGAMKTSPSTTMLIKTYRMVKSTRQALKDKYAFAPDDDAEVHLNRLRHRRRNANDVDILQLSEKHSIRAHKFMHQKITPAHTMQKRKVLRKRSVSNSCSAMDTSSESDNAYDRRYVDKHFRGKHKCCGQRQKSIKSQYGTMSSDVAASVKRSQYKSARSNRYSRNDQIYYYERTRSDSVSSSSSLSSSPTFSSVCKKKCCKCIDKRQHNKYRSPKLGRESRGCNEKRMCQEYTHLSDASGDERFVENSYISKKLQITTTSEQIISNGRATHKFCISGNTNTIDNATPISTTRTIENNSKTSNKSRRKKTEEPKERLNDTSKECHKNNQPEMCEKIHGKLHKKGEPLPTKTPSHETTLVGKRHLKRHMPEEVLTATNKEEDSTVFLKPSLIKTPNATIEGSEDTFFGVSPKVCNSTALPNDTPACQRQIEGGATKPQTAKRGSKPKRKSSTAIVFGENSDSDKTKSLKNVQNIDENYTKVKYRATKELGTSSLDTNLAKDSLSQNVETPRTKNKTTSTKLVKTSSEQDIIDYNEHVFAKPKACPKKNSNSKSYTKPVAAVNSFLGSQVNKNASAEFNDKSVFEKSYLKPSIGKSVKKQQENETLPFELSSEEERDNYTSDITRTMDDAPSCYSVVPSPKLKLDETTNNSSKTSRKSHRKKTEEPKEEVLDDSFELELRIALKLSEELYEKEQKQKSSKRPVEENTKLETLPRKRLAKTSSNDEMVIDKQRLKRQLSDVALTAFNKVELKCNKIKEDNTCFNKTKTQNPNSNKSLSVNAREYQEKRQSLIDVKKLKLHDTSYKPSNSNVSSSTLHSPDISTYLRTTRRKYKQVILDDTLTNENDCTVVSSTTNIEPPHIPPPTDTHTEVETNTSRRPKQTSSWQTSFSAKTRNPLSFHHPQKGILIYSPHNPSLAPAKSFSNDGCYFHITKEHLSSVIGEKLAEKFFKYYIGRRRFSRNSTIYFKPPAARVLDTNDASSSDSDVDELESMGQYGDLYESVEGAANNGSYNESDNDTLHF